MVLLAHWEAAMVAWSWCGIFPSDRVCCRCEFHCSIALAHHQRGPVVRRFVVGAIVHRRQIERAGEAAGGDVAKAAPAPLRLNPTNNASSGTPNFRFAVCIRRRGTLAKVPRASSLKID
jgi:hypothetical protein